MKTRLFTVLVILAIGLAGFTRPAQAQAYGTSFTTSITYQNVGTAATTTLNILFYASPTDTSPTIIPRDPLAAGAGTSVSIGTLTSIDPGFRGSAVMQADQPLLATLVQVPSGAVKVRPMSNGFAAGAAQSLIATVLKNQFGADTIFSVQNVDDVDNDINIKFYDTTATLKHEADFNDVASGAAVYWDTGAAGDPLPNPFNGSAVITAVRSAGGDGLIVSSAMELDTAANGAKAFEGVSEGSTDFFMPSALCKFNSSGALQDTSYAVQNTDLSTATNVTVTFDNGVSDTKAIGPGAKASFVTCNAPGMPEGYKGAALVHSDTTPVIAVGKAYNGGLSTAFVGAAAGSGTAKVALPYVRYATTANYAGGSSSVLSQRAFITIQNIGTAPITGDITVQYVTCTGAVAGTHTIPAPGGSLAVGAKVNSNAGMAGLTEFGYCGGGGPQYGGGAMVTGPAGSQLAVVVRVQQLDTGSSLYVGEDYNGINAP
jgi:hypothetical protein